MLCCDSSGGHPGKSMSEASESDRERDTEIHPSTCTHCHIHVACTSAGCLAYLPLSCLPLVFADFVSSTQTLNVEVASLNAAEQQ